MCIETHLKIGDHRSLLITKQFVENLSLTCVRVRGPASRRWQNGAKSAVPQATSKSVIVLSTLHQIILRRPGLSKTLLMWVPVSSALCQRDCFPSCT